MTKAGLHGSLSEPGRPRLASTLDKSTESRAYHRVSMAARDDAGQHGHRVAMRLRSELGRAILEARLDAGISQQSAAAAAGMSRAQFGRIERLENSDLTLEQLCRAAAAVGLRLTARAFPDGDPARDAGQLALIERFRSQLSPALAWRTEVPLPIPGDRRAWDAVVGHEGRRTGCEAETRPRDVQALARRLALKQRDGQVDTVVLVVADTPGNRRLLRVHRETLRAQLPLDTRQVLLDLRAGRLPASSGIVVI